MAELSRNIGKERALIKLSYDLLRGFACGCLVLRAVHTEENFRDCKLGSVRARSETFQSCVDVLFGNCDRSGVAQFD